MKRATLVLAVVWTALAVLSFLLMCTYCVITPGSTGTGFSDPLSPVDRTQEVVARLWMIWGVFGTFIVWCLHFVAPTRKEEW